MKKEILEKCLVELAAEAPRLDYIRGMLETLIALSPQEVSTAALKAVLDPLPAPKNAGYLDEIRRMSGEQS